jgi:RNA recognition motif-containing protein
MFVTIFIGNLSHQISREDLEEVFAEYGTVKKVVIPIDRETGRVRGFAFVDMAGEDQEDKAIDELDGAEWMGRQLRVNKARPRQDNPNRGERSGNRGTYRARF